MTRDHWARTENEFSWYFDRGNLDRKRRHYYRIECGIAGRGHAWNVVELPEGTPRGPRVTTRHALRRQVLETPRGVRTVV